MTSVEHKWYDNIDQKGRAKIIFSLKRPNSKQIAKFTPNQRASALGFIDELKKLLQT